MSPFHTIVQEHRDIQDVVAPIHGEDRNVQPGIHGMVVGGARSDRSAGSAGSGEQLSDVGLDSAPQTPEPVRVGMRLVPHFSHRFLAVPPSQYPVLSTPFSAQPSVPPSQYSLHSTPSQHPLLSTSFSNPFLVVPPFSALPSVTPSVPPSQYPLLSTSFSVPPSHYPLRTAPFNIPFSAHVSVVFHVHVPHESFYGTKLPVIRKELPVRVAILLKLGYWRLWCVLIR